MGYNQTTWKDKAVEKPRTFRIQNNSDGTVTLIPAEGTIYEPGTPVNAGNMNKLEKGIKDALPKDGSEAMTGQLKTKDIFIEPQTSNANSYSQPLYLQFIMADGSRHTAYLQVSPTGSPVYAVDGVPYKILTSGDMGHGGGIIADTVDGFHGAQLIPKERFASSGTNLNTLTESGFYRLAGDKYINAPSGVDYGNIIVSHSGDTIFQIVTGFNNNQIYWRQGNPPDVGGSGSWSPWKKIWHDGNMGSGSGLDADKLRGAYNDAQPTAYTIVQRGGSGEVNATNINATVVNATAGGSTLPLTARNANGAINLYPFSDGYDYIQAEQKMKITQAGGQRLAEFCLDTNRFVLNGDLQPVFRISNGYLEYNDGAWKAAGGVKKVQRGEFTHSSGSEVTQPLGAVNKDKSYVIISYTGEYSTYAINSDVRARIIDANNVGFYKRSANPVDIAWQVVEFY